MFFGAYALIKLKRLDVRNNGDDYNYNVLRGTPLVDGTINCEYCEGVICGIAFNLPHSNTSGFEYLDLTDLDFPAIKKEFARKHKKVIQKLRLHPDVKSVVIYAGWINNY